MKQRKLSAMEQHMNNNKRDHRILEEENMILKMRTLRKMYKKFLYKE
jgi:hypothetical protein